jgi:predicted aspartyl protease
MKSLFKRNKDGLIIINAVFNGKLRMKLMLDTGATHTTFDSNALHIFGFDFKNRLGSVMVETAKGIIVTDLYSINSLSTLGILKENFPVQVYDFLANGIFNDYVGILGLDFLEGYHFCIDTLKEEITIQE